MNNNRLLYKNKGVSRPTTYMGKGAEFERYSDTLAEQREEAQRRRADREARLQALEIARSNSLKTTAVETPEAGDNRTTSNKTQSKSVMGGLGITFDATKQGMNTASSGADIDYSTQAKKDGWRGIGNAITQRAKGNTISKEESLTHATEVVSPYQNNQKAMDALKKYSDLEDQQTRTGMLNFQSIGSFSGQFDKYANEFINETGVSMDEFRKIAENYSYLKHNEDRLASQEDIQNSSGLEKVAKSVGGAAISPFASYWSAIGALQQSNDPELGRDYNTPFANLANKNADVREAVHNDIDKIENPVAKTLLGIGYDFTVMGEESLATAMMGPLGLPSFAAGGYASGLENAEERGLNNSQAQLYGLTTGALEYFTEKLPLENLQGIMKGGVKAAKGSLKPYIKEILKQGGYEATEEIVNGIGELIADSLIAGDKSNISYAIQSYMNDGLSEEEATRKAYLDSAKDTAYSALVAFLSAGVSTTGAVGVNAISNTRTGREQRRREILGEEEEQRRERREKRDSFILSPFITNLVEYIVSHNVNAKRQKYRIIEIS